MPQVHLCVATEQVQPLLLPVLELKPAHVLVLETPGMKEKGRGLLTKNVLVAAGVAPDNIGIVSDFPESSPTDIAARLQEVLAVVHRHIPDADILFNATGGTKLISIVIADCLGSEVPAFYCDTRNETLVWIRPPQRTPIPLQARMDLPLAVATTGRVILGASSDDPVWRERQASRAAIAAQLFRTAGIGERNWCFAALNSACSDAVPKGDVLLNKAIAIKKPFPQPYTDILKKLAAQGEITLEPRSIGFSDVSAARFLSGFWLEESVYALAMGLGFDSVSSGVEVALADSRATNNDIDVIVLHHNRLLFIECKTWSPNRIGSAISESVYKLDSLAGHAGGVQASKLLVSLNALPPQSLARARDADISVCSGKELKKLRRMLGRWKDGDSLHKQG